MRISDWSSDVCSSDLDVGVDADVAQLLQGEALELAAGHLATINGGHALQQGLQGRGGQSGDADRGGCHGGYSSRKKLGRVVRDGPLSSPGVSIRGWLSRKPHEIGGRSVNFAQNRARKPLYNRRWRRTDPATTRRPHTPPPRGSRHN